MDELAHWFEQQAKRERRAVYLEDALLSNRFWAYALYRLRFFFLRCLAESLVHAVRVLLVYVALPGDLFVILVTQSAVGLLTGFWWGALEVMRARVRHLYRQGKPHRIPGEIGRWLSFSLQTGSAVIAGATIWLFWRFMTSGAELSPTHVYLWSLLLGLGLSCVARCYHSGIYAIRRIYRPFLAMIAVELVSGVGVLALWPWLGAWSLPAVALFATLAIAALTFYYTSRMYHFFQFDPWSCLNLSAGRFPARSDLRDFLGGGLAYAAMSLDALLVLILAGSTSALIDGGVLAALFFLVSPAVRAGLEWAQLFYFDLKRLETDLFSNLRKRFERSMHHLALVLGFGTWALAVLMLALVYRGNLDAIFYWITLPFFISRSLLAVRQMAAFGERAYGKVMQSALVLLLAIATFSFTVNHDGEKILWLTAATTAAFLLLKLRQPGVGDSADRGQVLPLTDWVRQVSHLDEAVEISTVRLRSPLGRRGKPGGVPPGTGAWEQRRLADQIARRLGRLGAVTTVYPDRIAWFHRGASSRVTGDWLITHGSGRLQDFESTGVQASGLQAIQAGCLQNLLGSDLSRAWSDAPAPANTSDLQARFSSMFPSGVIHAVDQSPPPLFLTLSSRERRMILSDAAAFARSFRPSSKQSRFDVTAYCFGGELCLIFLVDRKTDRRLSARWRETVKQFNLQAALAPPPELGRLAAV